MIVAEQDEFVALPAKKCIRARLLEQLDALRYDFTRAGDFALIPSVVMMDFTMQHEAAPFLYAGGSAIISQPPTPTDRALAGDKSRLNLFGEAGQRFVLASRSHFSEMAQCAQSAEKAH